MRLIIFFSFQILLEGETTMRARSALSIFAALLMLIGVSQALNAQRGAWIHLGDKHVDGNADHDKISIGRSDGRFRQLQIRVDDAPVNFQRVADNHLPQRHRERRDCTEKLKSVTTTTVVYL